MTLEVFEQSILACIQDAGHRTSGRDQIGREMANLQLKLEGFERLSAQLVDGCIRPRLALVAARFTNADLDRHERNASCGASFGYCNRYPATVRVTFVVQHDDTVENLLFRFEVRIQPVFFKYEPHDKLVLPIHDLDEKHVARWVEERLLSFLHDYLRLDRGEESLDEDLLTDPVCGMRLARNAVAANETYRGHSYYFCTEECLQKFSKDPSRYVWFRT